MIRAQEHFGGIPRLYTATGTVHLHNNMGRFQTWDVVSIIDLILPDARNLQAGGPHFTIIRTSASTMRFLNHESESSLKIAGIGGSGVHVYLLDNTTEDGVWAFRNFVHVGN